MNCKIVKTLYFSKVSVNFNCLNIYFLLLFGFAVQAVAFNLILSAFIYSVITHIFFFVNCG